jgi:hypothetical protein
MAGEGRVSYTKLCWISLGSGFRLTFISSLSLIHQIYIMRKVKIQGVQWCKNQGGYGTS